MFMLWPDRKGWGGAEGRMGGKGRDRGDGGRNGVCGMRMHTYLCGEALEGTSPHIRYAHRPPHSTAQAPLCTCTTRSRTTVRHTYTYTPRACIPTCM